MAKNIYVATPTRGFLNQLFNFNSSILNFDNTIKSYEAVSRNKVYLNKIARSGFMDKLGFIHSIKVKDLESEVDLAFSYNKFLRTSIPYFIYLENPFALVNYSIERPYTYLSKRKLHQYLSDERLKGIICASKACFETLVEVYDIPKSLKIFQNYPLISNSSQNFEELKLKKNDKELHCLFVASRFIIKGGLEVLELFNRFHQNSIADVKLTLVTVIDDLDDDILNLIENTPNIELIDYNLTSGQMMEMYSSTDILLNPTRMDSFSLVTLESMKYGNAIISSDLYAINEMVIENFNGYLLKPKYRFFNYDNLPNPLVWNNRNSTVGSNFIDQSMVDSMFEKLIYLNSNRNKLNNMQFESFKLANEGEFNDLTIFNNWLEIFEDI